MTSKIVAQAPGQMSCFFGFHDVSPWSPDDQDVLLLQVDPEIRRLPRPGDWASILLWSPETDKTRLIGKTDTWNFQQGARAMWIPTEGRRVIYNRRINDAPGCEIVDLDSGDRRELPHAVGAISPDGAYGFAPNFARLGVLWPAYGYAGFVREEELQPRPHDDGLWRIDLSTGGRTLVFSIKELAEIKGVEAPTSTKLFVTHISFNRRGSRIVFMLRFMTQDDALYSIIFSARPDGTDLRLLAQEKVSHFDWIDEDNIILWMRKSVSGLAAARKSGLLASPFVKPLVNVARMFRGRIKGKLLNESYFIVSTVTDVKEPFMPGQLPLDGHPMISPDLCWMILDEYPEPQGGRTPLILVEMSTRKRYDVHTFIHDVGSKDKDLKCDLHPRWNRAGTQVGVDATADGRRCFMIIDLAEWIGQPKSL
ncbi:MAG: hypothetical protein VBE63_14275 [Lamprobacter sp.]|uniref:hypothetical protein n=1 Tax=Lamprobacter sp. TaxID=3100796 RepID=UPI002B26050D|nr:hypothetical protein [Lamprobacter sp.]MEA3641090.1 hypothetical protein [Lamprobacter sp.]